MRCISKGMGCPFIFNSTALLVQNYKELCSSFEANVAQDFTTACVDMFCVSTSHKEGSGS